MTLNLVLKAKGGRSIGQRSPAPKSRERWLAAGDCR